MSRIHRILSKAEEDGTTANLCLPSDVEARSDRVLPISRGRAALPTVNSLDGAPAVYDREAGSLVGGKPVFGVKMSRLLVAAHDPFSQAAEQYRLLRARLTQAEGGAVRRVIAITSPGRGDGKSVTVANLALSSAQEFDRRTLLIDADLRHARLHSLLGIVREPGLVDVLSGSVPIDEALVTLPGHRLQVLPAGVAHMQPAELLGSAPMLRLMDLLRQHFDRVLIDVAAAQTADAGALEASIDGALLVVRSGRTPKPAIKRALSVIPAGKLVGLVLNDSRRSDGLSVA